MIMNESEKRRLPSVAITPMHANCGRSLGGVRRRATLPSPRNRVHYFPTLTAVLQSLCCSIYIGDGAASPTVGAVTASDKLMDIGFDKPILANITTSIILLPSPLLPNTSRGFIDVSQ